MATFDFIDNRVFDDRVTAFAPQGQMSKPGKERFERIPLNTGVKVFENGDARFGFFAPGSGCVKLDIGGRLIDMEKDADGVWTVTLPYSPLVCGPKTFTFNVDGATLISQYCPIYYSCGVAINYVELPDPGAPFVLMRDVPHGSVNTEYYWSDSLGTWQRCLVYVPPMYCEGGEYPVLYLQHGAGENETSWVYNGKANHIMDNLIADGKAVPSIVVMNDGMVRGKNDRFGGRGAFEATLLENCVPYIEKKYRCVADKWHRGIAGFSMGSMQSCSIGLSNLDKFAYIGLLSGFMAMTRDDSEIPTAVEKSPTLRILNDKARFLDEVRLFYRAIGSADMHYASYERDSKIVELGGYDSYPNFVSRVVEGYPHDWAVLRILFADFAERMFK